MLLIKHGGQLLAKLPVVPGAERRINVPLPDDEARLVAEARLAAVREDLIDVVARRNILMARTRQKIEKKDFAAAQAVAALARRPARQAAIQSHADDIGPLDPQRRPANAAADRSTLQGHANAHVTIPRREAHQPTARRTPRSPAKARTQDRQAG